MQELSKKKLGYTEGVLSVIINTLLFGVKIWVGTAAASVAMTADAWHTLSDTLTSLVVILGFWISGRPKDEEHPFGHGRAEVIASVVIATLLAVVGVSFFRDAVHQLIVRKNANFTVVSLVVFAVSVVIKEGLARFSLWAGKKAESQSLVADGWHHRSDALASLLIVVGAIVGKYVWWIDGVLGIGVSVLILYAAYDIAKSASNGPYGRKCRARSFRTDKKDSTRGEPRAQGHPPYPHAPIRRSFRNHASCKIEREYEYPGCTHSFH